MFSSSAVRLLIEKVATLPCFRETIRGDHFGIAMRDAKVLEAQRVLIEATTKELIKNEREVRIGGVMQKMEVAWNGQQSVVTFTEDRGTNLIDALPEIGKSLKTVPLSESMAAPKSAPAGPKNLPG